MAYNKIATYPFAGADLKYVNSIVVSYLSIWMDSKLACMDSLQYTKVVQDWYQSVPV